MPLVRKAAGAMTGAAAAMLGLGGRFFRFLPRTLVDRVVPAPGAGPSEQTRERGHYTIETYTSTDGTVRCHTTPTAQATTILRSLDLPAPARVINATPSSP